MGLSWPLIGRSGEMRSIQAAIAASDVAGIVVRGAAGVGKSRIAREALAAAQSAGWGVQWVVGSSSARAVPLGAFSAWAQSGVTDAVQLVHGVIESLTGTSPAVGAVLAVDDAHLLDDLSAFVLHQIVQRGAAKVILTAVDGEPVPAAVQELWKVGFDRLDLQPLTLDDTTTLLSEALGALVDHIAAQRFWSLTHGNVLYLRNIVEQEVADERLVQRHGCWQWIGDPVVPPSLVELIEARIGTLPARVSDVLDLLAVGEPIDLAALRRITDSDAIEDADGRGLITLERLGGRVVVRIAHPLYGEVRRRRAPATRLRRLRGMVATELAASEDPDDIQAVVRRATLSLDSDLEPDAGLFIKAARGAVWLADLPLADRLAHAASRAGAGAEPDFVRAHALSWLGRGEDADAVLLGLSKTELSEGDRARLTFMRASNMLWALADPAAAKMLIDGAPPSALPLARNYIHAFRTVYWFATDQPDAALQESKNLALEDLPAVVGAEIAWVLTAIAGDTGRTAEAVAAAEAGYAIADRSLDAPHMRFNIADAHVSALLLAGRVTEALDVAARVRQQAANLPGAAQLLGAAIAGRAALGAGRLDEASALLEQAVAGLSVTHAIGWGYRYQVPRLTVSAMRGPVGEAAASLAAHDALPRPFRQLDYERSLARAWVAAGQGAVSEAIAVALAAAERASSRGQFAAEVACLQTAAQFGDRSCAHRLGELEGAVEGPRVGLAARFADALSGGDAAELSSLSEELEQIGDLVAAIDASAHAALAFRRQDKRGSALGSSSRAEALAVQCGGAITPALRLAGEPLPLTAREAEVVMLLGQGLSNRAIAERMTVSVRTVESHIYRAMVKTGTADREQLAALLAPGRD
jgi:DNA-binding CsgD family transcriptional regulator